MTVIVGSGKGGGKKKRLLLIGGVVALVIIAGGAGVGLRLLQNNNTDSDTQNRPKGTGMPAAIDEIQELRAQGYAESADLKISEALDNPDTPDKERYLLYIQQGNTFLDKQNPQAAIASYLKAEAIDAKFEIVSLLGYTYQSAGDTAKAIEYFKKAIPLVPESPLQDDEKKNLEGEITRLGGQL